MTPEKLFIKNFAESSYKALSLDHDAMRNTIEQWGEAAKRLISEYSAKTIIIQCKDSIVKVTGPGLTSPTIGIEAQAEMTSKQADEVIAAIRAMQGEIKEDKA